MLACLLGMASKEVMVSAPLIVLLFDRTFLAGSFGEAWRRRYGVHSALAGTWLLLGWLVIVAGNRGGSAGFDAGGVSSWAYLCTQFGAIVHYLNLSVWPHRLLFDYGPDTAAVTYAIVPDAMLVGVLGLATIVALWRWPKMGFLGAWFFAILAPTSSIVPVATQIAAEHRMYLPLAAVVTGVIFGGYTACWVLACRGLLSPRMAGVFGVCVATAVALTLGSLTYRRNADFHSDLSIWQDTVRKSAPQCPHPQQFGDRFWSRRDGSTTPCSITRSRWKSSPGTWTRTTIWQLCWRITDGLTRPSPSIGKRWPSSPILREPCAGLGEIMVARAIRQGNLAIPKGAGDSTRSWNGSQ